MCETDFMTEQGTGTGTPYAVFVPEGSETTLRQVADDERAVEGGASWGHFGETLRILERSVTIQAAYAFGEWPPQEAS